MTTIFDFVIRNQVTFIFILFLLTYSSLLSLLSRYSENRHEPIPGAPPKENSTSFLKSLFSIKTFFSYGIPIIAYIVIAVTKPIPAAIGIEFPKIQNRGEQVSFDGINNLERNLIIFVHGWMGDPKETWRQFPDLIEKDERFKKFDVVSLHYPTYLSRRNLQIPEIADWVIEGISSQNGWKKYNKITFVAHSIGGLIAREIVILKALQQASLNIKLLIEVASPHDGTNFSGLAAVLGIPKDLTKDLKHNSSFLRGLQTRWKNIPSEMRPMTHCYTSPHDRIVSESSAIFQCESFTKFPKWGHKDLVKPSNLVDERYTFPAFKIFEVMKSP